MVAPFSTSVPASEGSTSTVAVLVTTAPSCRLASKTTCSVKVATVKAGRRSAEQSTPPGEPTAGVLQDQPAGAEIDRNVVLRSSGVSLIVTSSASSGPLLT